MQTSANSPGMPVIYRVSAILVFPRIKCGQGVESAGTGTDSSIS
ncbi:MAG: hypothetical protein PXX83_08315 [Candidatus Nitrosotalea sp.]|nr:hypothetical protein [Candidatus Nitrosotalea sp.]